MRLKYIFLVICCLTLHNILFGQYTKLFDFNYSTTGAYPYYGALISDGTYLYGTASNGGANSSGVLFKIKRDGSDYELLYEFDDTIANVPESGVISDGTYLYGTTKFGGTEGYGTVYRIKPDGSDFSIIANFDFDVYGAELHGALYFDGTYLFGMASSGGANGRGTIYKIKPDGSDFSVVFNFEITATGNSPYGHLISDGEYLYGMTPGGGISNLGVAFKIKPDGTGYTNLIEFTDDPNGAWGYGSLVYDGTEYLYGMTNNGGEGNRGTIFKVRTDGTGYEKLLDMDNTNGAQPLGSLILQGTTLYGMTELAGNDAEGNVYSIETDGSNFTTLVDFDGDNGSIPFGTLLYEDGALFGMTTEGGANAYGVIFRYGDIVESVKEIQSTPLTIYPNPAQTYFTIGLPEKYQNAVRVEVLNALGQKVYAGDLPGSNATIFIGVVPAGIYTVKAYEGDEVFAGRVVFAK